MAKFSDFNPLKKNYEKMQLSDLRIAESKAMKKVDEATEELAKANADLVHIRQLIKDKQV